MLQANPTDRTAITMDGIRRGAVQMLPVAVFVVPFGLAFGVAAKAASLGAIETVAMSATVFAAAAQFAVLDIWGASMPLLPLITIALAVNARHILMGASLYPWLENLPWRQRLWSMGVLSDANFALSMTAYEAGERDDGHLVGGGLALWLAWVAGTAAGVGFGAAIAHPRAYALDVVMIAFFAALLAGTWKGRATLWPWLAAAAVSLIVHQILGPTWHVISGAVAGGLIGAMVDGD